MKSIILTFLLLTTNVVWAEESSPIIFYPEIWGPSSRHTMQLEVGESFDRSCGSCDNPSNEFFTVGYRYYFSKKKLHHLDSGWFGQARITTFGDGNGVQNSHGGTWIGGSMGYRTKGNKFPNALRRVFLEGSVGWGRLDHPDGHDIKGQPSSGKLSQHGQFEILLGGGYRLTRRINIVGGIGHFSNCRQLCNRNSPSSTPNHGRDQVRAGIEIKFKTR